MAALHTASKVTTTSSAFLRQHFNIATSPIYGRDTRLKSAFIGMHTDFAQRRYQEGKSVKRGAVHRVAEPRTLAEQIAATQHSLAYTKAC
jgi:hypothetical protein